MDEQTELNRLARLYQDETLHPVLMRLWDVWQLFEICTLTLTHPELPDYSRQYFTQLAEQFQQFVLAEYPDLADHAAACWKRGPDSPIDAEIKRKLRKRYR